MTFFRLARRLLLVSPALLVALSCGGGDAQSSPTQTPTAVIETPTPLPATPTAVPPILGEDSTLVFIRHPVSIFPLLGELWISDGDGENARRVSPRGVTAAYAGKVRGKSGVDVYFVTEEGEEDRSVWRLEIDSGEAQPVFSYQSPPNSLEAAVSPDGAYIAFVESTGLSLLNVASGDIRLLLASGDRTACANFDLFECHGDDGPQWSPDGRLLLVTHTVYEGGWVQVIDPFADPPMALVAGAREVPSSGFWSPSSGAVCAMGVYGGNSGLYLLEGPDWEPQNRFPGYEDWTMNPEGRSVADCAWLDESEVAYVTFSQTPSRAAELDVLNTPTDDWRVVALFEEVSSCCTGRVMAVEGQRLVVAQFFEHDERNSVRWARPQIVDVDSGESRLVLETDDVVVAAFTR